MTKIKKRWDKERRKICKHYELTIAGLRDNLVIINQRKKECEVSLKIWEPKKVELERKLRAAETGLKHSTDEVSRIGKSDAFLKISLDTLKGQIKAKEEEIVSLELRIKEESRDKKVKILFLVIIKISL
jgi:chromosome segregation ATPase